MSTHENLLVGITFKILCYLSAIIYHDKNSTEVIDWHTRYMLVTRSSPIWGQPKFNSIWEFSSKVASTESRNVDIYLNKTTIMDLVSQPFLWKVQVLLNPLNPNWRVMHLIWIVLFKGLFQQYRCREYSVPEEQDGCFTLFLFFRQLCRVDCNWIPY